MQQPTSRRDQCSFAVLGRRTGPKTQVMEFSPAPRDNAVEPGGIAGRAWRRLTKEDRPRVSRDVPEDVTSWCPAHDVQASLIDVSTRLPRPPPSPFDRLHKLMLLANYSSLHQDPISPAWTLDEALFDPRPDLSTWRSFA